MDRVQLLREDRLIVGVHTIITASEATKLRWLSFIEPVEQALGPSGPSPASEGTGFGLLCFCAFCAWPLPSR